MSMLETVKKIVLSLSVIVLFALYAMQRQARSLMGSLAIAEPAASASSSVVVPSPAEAAWSSTFRDFPTVATAATTSPPAAATSAATVGADAPMEAPTPTPTPSDNGSDASLTSAGAAPSVAAATGKYRVGTYDGGPADANWGEVDVQAVVAGGQLSDVRFVQYPNHRGRSVAINQQAMPILTQEAVQAQQAEVDVVTGATDTSEAFIQSLGAALQQAAT
jgi:uncharacterized protein with FMN-binding domain